MGIIVRQSIKHSIVGFSGIAIGAINTIFIYTYFLSMDEFGFIQFLQNTALLYLPFVQVGIGLVAIRLFPILKENNGERLGFLILLFSWLVMGFFLLSTAYFIFNYGIIDHYGEKWTEYIQYFIYFLPLILCMASLNLFVQYSSNFQRTAIPEIFNNLLIKILLPVAIIAYAFSVFQYEGLVRSVVALYGIAAIGAFLYLLKLMNFTLRPDFGFLKRESFGEQFYQFAGFGFFTTIGGAFVVRMDIFMLGTLLEENVAEFVAIYVVAGFIAMIIEFPKKSIAAISNPIVANGMRHELFEDIKSIYKKSSLNQIIAGVLLLLLIWSSLDNLFEIMPKGDKYAQGKYIILILGLAKITDMTTGVSGAIMVYSKYYKYDLFLLLLLAGLNIIFNIFFISQFGFFGAAVSTLLSIMLWSILKCTFIYYKFKIHPLSAQTFWVFFLGLSLFFLFYFLPLSGNPYLDIVLRSGMIGLLYLFIIYKTKTSADINQILDTGINFIKKYL